MTRVRSSIILFFFAVLLASVAPYTVFADTPNCNCDELADGDPLVYLDCVENGCYGVDVPVSGNIWLLAMAGFVFAFVKFGGHTKLAGYYYSRFEKQE